MQKILVNYNRIKKLGTCQLFLGKNKSSLTLVVCTLAFSLSFLESEFCGLIRFGKLRIQLCES
jgi:hypothetical protein